MLIVNKNNISFAKGEAVTIRFTILNTNGEPYVLPPKPIAPEVVPGVYGNLKSVVILTVRADIYDKPVLTYVLDMDGPNTHIVINGHMDHSPDGYNRFVSQDIEEVADDNEALAYLIAYPNRVVKSVATGKFWFYRMNQNETYTPAEYNMDFAIQINAEDTRSLEAKHYKYDLVYCMATFNEQHEMEQIVYKREFIPVHDFILGDTLNA